MTAKIKAEDLVYKIKCLYPLNMDMDIKNRHELAKACALIAVDEVLSLLIKNEKIKYVSILNYWQMVKQEIEKL